METDFRNGIVLNSIDELRNVKKVQQDKERIHSYAAKEYGLDEGRAAEALKILVDKKLVNLKSTPSGQDSYFIDKEFDAYNVEIEQLFDNKRDVPYHQSASSPDCNASPLIAGIVHTMEDYQTKNDSLARDTTVFRILEKFGDIINNLNQQLYKAKVLNRSLAKENLDLKVEIEKIVEKIESGKQKSSRANS